MSKVIKRQQSTESMPGMGGRNKMQSEGVTKRKTTEEASYKKRKRSVSIQDSFYEGLTWPTILDKVMSLKGKRDLVL